MLRLILSGFAVAIAFEPVSAQGRPDSAPSWAAVEKALGKQGAPQPGGVIRFSFPRSDLAVTLDSVALKPAFALGGWLAFKPLVANSALVMGDLVLTEREIPTVMRELQAGGVEETALHNHLFGETPHVMYMHVMARGNAAAIAATVRRALSQTSTPIASAAAPGQAMTIPASAPNPTTSDLDTARIARTLGTSGRLNGVVYQVSVPRKERITMMGEEIPPSLGVATAINFQPTGGGRAAITGDFVLRAAEVSPVMRALQAGGIEITALHSHMIDEQPRLFFMHFWANDDAVRLAGVLRTALDLIANKDPSVR